MLVLSSNHVPLISFISFNSPKPPLAMLLCLGARKREATLATCSFEVAHPNTPHAPVDRGAVLCFATALPTEGVSPPPSPPSSASPRVQPPTHKRGPFCLLPTTAGRALLAHPSPPCNKMSGRKIARGHHPPPIPNRASCSAPRSIH